MRKQTRQAQRRWSSLAFIVCDIEEMGTRVHWRSLRGRSRIFFPAPPFKFFFLLPPVVIKMKFSH